MFWEELACLCLFSRGKFSYKAERETELGLTKYFSQRLLNSTQLFTLDTDYIFSLHCPWQTVKTSNSHQYCNEKGLLISQQRCCYKILERIGSFIVKDEVCNFMYTSKGTSAY